MQTAFDAGHLPLIEAGKIADLDEVKQLKIVEALRKQGLENAKAICDGYLPSKAASVRGATNIWIALKRVARDVKQLRNRMTNIRLLDDQDLMFLDEFIELLDGLRDEVDAYLEALDDDDEEFSDTGEPDHLD